MEKPPSARPPPLQQVQLPQKRTRWLLPLLASLLLTSLLISASLFSPPSSSSSSSVAAISPTFGGGGGGSDGDSPLFVEDQLRASLRRPAPSSEIPRIAYVISGSAGDGESLRRVLRALYHPLNTYAVHLDLEAPAAERMELASTVQDDPVYARFGNVRVIVKANLVTYRGPTMVANTLHAAAILLREGGDWDWFVNLSASDYPLVTQDGKSMEGPTSSPLPSSFPWLSSLPHSGDLLEQISCTRCRATRGTSISSSTRATSAGKSTPSPTPPPPQRASHLI